MRLPWYATLPQLVNLGRLGNNTAMKTPVLSAPADVKPFCPYYHAAVELIGRRWTGAIVRALLGEIHRFGELTATVPGLSDRMLSERLKELEAAGIVDRIVIPETPVRIEYHLTAKGRALAAVVEAVSAWACDWLPTETEA